MVGLLILKMVETVELDIWVAEKFHLRAPTY